MLDVGEGAMTRVALRMRPRRHIAMLHLILHHVVSLSLILLLLLLMLMILLLLLVMVRVWMRVGVLALNLLHSSSVR